MATSKSAPQTTSPIAEGRAAPAFHLSSHKGGKVRLSALQGKYVVLYFYPRDATPGCTQQAKDFRDAEQRLSEVNAVVLGVSKDSLESHEKFAAKHDLPFDLLSDPDATVLSKYGAWGEKKMYGKTFDGIIRSTVVIGPDGKVVKHFPKVRVKGHVDAVVAAIEEHQQR